MARDTVPQRREIRLEIRGSQEGVRVVLDGRPLRIGDRVAESWGLVDTVVDEGFLRLLAFLALRRLGGVADGWVTAEEVALLLDPFRTVGAIRKSLERRLAPYTRPREDELDLSALGLPGSWLVQYAPRRRIVGPRGGWLGGSSRGPYRLGLPPSSVLLDVDAAWDALLGHRSVASGRSPDPGAALVAADEAFVAGDLLGARQIVAAGLRAAWQGEGGAAPAADRIMLQARLWDRVANLDMELGQPSLCVAASRRAEALYERLRHPAGVAHARQVRAHGFGQVEDVRRALTAAEQAMEALGRARALKAGLARAGYVGVVGQRLSKVGRVRDAERRLVHAQRTCEDLGAAHWAAVWATRRAENAIAGGDLTAAERHIVRAHELWVDPRTTVPHRAAITRVTAGYLLAARRFDEALPWAREAQRIGVEKGMANQIRLMRPILVALGDGLDDATDAR